MQRRLIFYRIAKKVNLTDQLSRSFWPNSSALKLKKQPAEIQGKADKKRQEFCPLSFLPVTLYGTLHLIVIHFYSYRNLQVNLLIKIQSIKDEQLY